MDNIITNSNINETENKNNNNKVDLLSSSTIPPQKHQHQQNFNSNNNNLNNNNNNNNLNNKNNNNNNNNNSNNYNNKFKRWNGYSSSINGQSNGLNNNFNNTKNCNEQDLKKELEFRSLELMKKDEEILKLRAKLTTLSEQYTQELAICCHYSNNLSNLRKEVYQMKNQFLSKEEQYKKQILDLQYKLYCEYQPIGKLTT
ncbi:hypothetical protein ACTA71_005410 [Dictyostelium dimigraforme]